MTVNKTCEKAQKKGARLGGRGGVNMRRAARSEPADQFKVDQAGGQALRDGIGRIGEVFDQQIRDGVSAVDEVKDFESSPNVLKVPEWVVAAAVTLFAIQQ